MNYAHPLLLRCAFRYGRGVHELIDTKAVSFNSFCNTTLKNKHEKTHPPADLGHSGAM
jgi:hypothetical protein